MSNLLLDLVDPSPITYEFDCLKSIQPIGDLYIASIPFDLITKITYFDVRRVIQDERDVERYLGIQRPLNQKRVSDLEAYVNFYDASFPTAIIIAIEEEHASYDKDKKKLIVSNVKKGDENPSIAMSNLARVIDGQHRIAGLFNFHGDKFDVPVSIFVGADVSDQAHIFSTVNLEQTKVNRSLVYDLYALSKSRSPQKTCHNIAVALDKDKKSPFYTRIKRLGITTVPGRFEPISQAGFVEMLMRYISRDPKGDRDLILKGKSLERATDSDLWKLPFRNQFIDEKDIEIGEAIFTYFDAVRTVWPEAWESRKKEGLVLNRTNGFRALMRAYSHYYNLQGVPGGSISFELLVKSFSDLKIPDEKFNTANFPPGSTGEGRLFRILVGDESQSTLI